MLLIGMGLRWKCGAFINNKQILQALFLAHLQVLQKFYFYFVLHTWFDISQLEDAFESL